MKRESKMTQKDVELVINEALIPLVRDRMTDEEMDNSFSVSWLLYTCSRASATQTLIKLVWTMAESGKFTRQEMFTLTKNIFDQDR